MNDLKDLTDKKAYKQAVKNITSTLENEFLNLQEEAEQFFSMKKPVSSKRRAPILKNKELSALYENKVKKAGLLMDNLNDEDYEEEGEEEEGYLENPGKANS